MTHGAAPCPLPPSPYRFYQFWYNTDDRDVISYIKFFTWLSKAQVGELEQPLQAAPEQRAAQIRLAREVTRQVHGEAALERAEKASQALFGEEVAALGAEELLDVFQEAPCTRIEKSKLAGRGVGVVDFIALAGLAPSKGEARRLIEGGGVYLNNRRVSDSSRFVSMSDALHGRFVVLRRGQREFRLVELV